MEQSVNPGDHYVFCYTGELLFLNRLMRGTRHSQSSASTRSCTEPKDLKNSMVVVRLRIGDQRPLAMRVTSYRTLKVTR